MKRKSLFNSVLNTRPKRNQFNFTHEVKMSAKMSSLLPIYTEEILPGDKFSISSEIMMRLAPMVAPMMHRVDVTTHWFFVPNRIVYDDWENFITGGPDGTLEPGKPRIVCNDSTKSQFGLGSLPDYMGLPVLDGTSTVSHGTYYDAMPFRGYQKIYNEFYRDQNLTEPIDIKTTQEVTPEEQLDLMEIRKRAWSKDYFTSALPWPQRGPEVNIPVEFNYKPTSNIYNASDGTIFNEEIGGTSGNLVKKGVSDGDPVRLENLEEEGVGVSINELRTSNRLQEWLEKNARGGARYKEQLWNHFNVISDDARLQRPEFLGGGKQPIRISEVLQTSATNTQSSAVDASVQGNMAGHGISIGQNHGFKKSFKEHGFVHGIMSITPKVAYASQGIEKKWQRNDKYDYYWPSFAHLGEQEVLTKELYYDPSNVANGSTLFGYQERYAEYKYQRSRVAGDFRDTLNFWHMSRQFDNEPALNTSFVECDATERVFAVDDSGATDKLYVQILHKINAMRPMPNHARPRL